MKNTANIDSLLQLIDKKTLTSLIFKWGVDKNTTKLSSTELLRVLLSALLLRVPNYRELSLVFGVAKSTISDAIRLRSHGFFEDLCTHIVTQLHAQSRNRKFKRAVRELFAIDSSEIKVHGSLLRFPGFEQSLSKNAGAKIHVVWNVNQHWVEGFHITPFNDPDLGTAKRSFRVAPKAMYVFDKAYVDLDYWTQIMDGGAHFTTRLKETPRNQELKQDVLRNNDKDGVIFDGDWTPSERSRKNVKAAKGKDFRQIVYRDPRSKKVLHFITSEFSTPAQQIADIYKQRWGVELFFKWMKGQMNIRRLHVKSKNGMKSLLAIAILMHLLLELKRVTQNFQGTISELLKQIRSNEMRRKLRTKPRPVNQRPRRRPNKDFLRSTA